MNPVADVSFSALVVRNIVAWMSEKGWVKGKVAPVVVSTILNVIIQTALTLVDDVSTGKQLNAVLVKTAFATVIAAVYNDIKTSQVRYVEVPATK